MCFSEQYCSMLSQNYANKYVYSSREGMQRGLEPQREERIRGS